MNILSIQDKSITGGTTYYFKTFSDVNVQLKNTLTTYPTTEGAPITDHAYIEPATLNFSILLSQFYTGDNVFYYEGSVKKVMTMDEVKLLLNKWKTNFTRLKVNTRENSEIYLLDNMVIGNLSWTEDKEQRGIWKPSIGMTELRIATLLTQVVQFPATDSDKSDNNDSSDTGVDSGTVADGLGTIAGYIAKGALVGAALGGHPIIGGVIGGIWGAVKFFSKTSGD